jgi:hypothetical protein
MTIRSGEGKDIISKKWVRKLVLDMSSYLLGLKHLPGGATN